MFALGIRQKIVEDLDKFEVIPDINAEKRPYEAIFKSNLLLLLLRGTGELQNRL